MLFAEVSNDGTTKLIAVPDLGKVGAAAFSPERGAAGVSDGGGLV